jgi:hypothetical protein
MSDGQGSGIPVSPPVTPATSSSTRVSRVGRGRMRYTHNLIIHNLVNILYSGTFLNVIPVPSVFPSEEFKIEVKCTNNTDRAGLKVIGTSNDGSIVTENLSVIGNETAYSSGLFTNVLSLSSRSFVPGTNVIISCVDEAYQPLFWHNDYGPYGCTFSTTDGMGAGIRQQSTGLSTVIGHYVRLSYKAPVFKNMEFTISPGYDGKIFVPSTDFDIVCIPPKFIPIEWAFRAVEKES